MIKNFLLLTFFPKTIRKLKKNIFSGSRFFLTNGIWANLGIQTASFVGYSDRPFFIFA